eukprot:1380358-Amorphochlora_amoeboformis.AAC.1
MHQKNPYGPKISYPHTLWSPPPSIVENRQIDGFLALEGEVCVLRSNIDPYDVTRNLVAPKTQNVLIPFSIIPGLSSHTQKYDCFPLLRTIFPRKT